MSRIRTIKPEFWTSEQVISCSPLARLLFIGLWNFCDDNGVHPVSYVRLKAEIFPGDNYSIDEVKDWVSELMNNNLLSEYSIDNKLYWIVTGWKNHQRIDKPNPRHPLPLSDLKKTVNNSTTLPRTFTDSSTILPRGVDDCSTRDRKGREWKGKEKDIREVKTSPCSLFENDLSADTQAVFTHWQSMMDHPHAKLDKKRANKISQALKLDYSVEELKQAVDGCAKTPFNMGQNDRGQRYDDIELILRDASHIDRFIQNAIDPPIDIKSNNQKVDLMEGAI